MACHQEICITHYIATEVSNLIDLTGYASRLAYETARILFSQFTQVHSNITSDCAQDTFLAYGLTDSSLVRLAADHTILTDDKGSLAHYSRPVRKTSFLLKWFEKYASK
jgi:hypothetical protein